MHAPALLFDLRQLWRMRALLLVMARRDVRQRIAGSVGGLLWVWLPPLLTVGAYFLVFDLVFGMRLGENAPTSRVGTYLIVGMVGWMAFADSLQRGMMSLIESGDLLQKNPLPPVLFPARSVLASSTVFAPLVLLLIVLYAPTHHFASGAWATIPVLVLQMGMTFLLAYLLAIAAAALRDVVQFVGVLLSLGVFLSPVLFPMSLFPAGWRWLLWFNPITAPALGYQSALLQGVWPPWSVWVALGLWIVIPAGLLSVAIARSRDQIVDWL